LVVGLLISKYGINIIFEIFFVGLVSFVILSLFVKFDHHMILKQDNNATHDTTAINDAISRNQQGSSSSGSGGRDGDADERTSLISQNSIAGTNYMYDPSITTWSHQQEQPRPLLQSRRESQFSQNTRHGNIANTLYLSDDQFNALTNTPTTSLMALDVQMEANNELLQQHQQYLPPLGLVLSYIPTIDTSLSVFGALVLVDGEERDNSIILPDKSILKSLLVYTFMISILLYGIAHSMISQFLFLLLKDLGMSPFIIGLTGPIGGIAEVITFWFSRQVTYHLFPFSLGFYPHMLPLLYWQRSICLIHRYYHQMFYVQTYAHIHTCIESKKKKVALINFSYIP
jgi:hypothetical protein